MDVISLSLIFLIIFKHSSVSAGPKHDKLVVCYINTWKFLEPDPGLVPAVEYCTHMVYFFIINLDADTNRLYFLDNDKRPMEDAFKMLNKLKYTNPKLKILMGVADSLHRMVKSTESRKSFTEDVKQFLNKYNLDGIEIKWEPNIKPDGKIKGSDNVLSLVKEMNKVLGPINKTISLAVMGTEVEKMNGIASLSVYAHHISVMTFDYHQSWDKRLVVNAALSRVESTLKILKDNGAQVHKLLLGISSTARNNTFDSSPTTPTSEDGKIARQIQPQGIGEPQPMRYNEFCKLRRKKGWTNIWHGASQTSFLTDGRHFIFCEDPRSICEKVSLVVGQGLGGVMFNTLCADDYHHCAKTPYPLLRAINEVLQRNKVGSCSCSRGFTGMHCATKCPCDVCDPVIGDCLEGSNDFYDKSVIDETLPDDDDKWFRNGPAKDDSRNAENSNDKVAGKSLSKTIIVVITVICTAMLFILLMVFIFFGKIRQIFQKIQPTGRYSEDAYLYENTEQMYGRPSREGNGNPLYAEIGQKTPARNAEVNTLEDEDINYAQIGPKPTPARNANINTVQDERTSYAQVEVTD